jgi:two-component system sensor histidine kinase KdpD
VLTGLLTILLSLFISYLTVRWRDVAIESEARAVELDRLNRYTRELESERLRNSVLSALSHDLRTPLASMVGASSSLSAKDITLTPEAKQSLAELIFEESQRMQVLVENLLDMARLESGPVVLQLDWQALEEIIGAALSQWRTRLLPRKINISWPNEIPLLRFDPRLMERVFVNLLENIGKYTPATASVYIAVEVSALEVDVVVEDDGPGFSGDPDRLFHKFCRGDNAAETSGAGLGLAICRSIMEAHGGKISARARQPHGACFIVTLPRTAESDLPNLLDEDDVT